MEKVSLKSKINEIRLELSREMSKSGKNTYSKYDYFQLKDFMPMAIALMNDKGVYTEFQMLNKRFELPGETVTTYLTNENGESKKAMTTEKENWEYRELAILDVYNLDDEEDMIHLEKPTANVSLQAAQPIQNLGGKNTYMKRYMYMDLFEINENDAVEAETGKPVKVETKTTKTIKPKTVEVETKPEPVKEELKEDPVEETPLLDDIMSMSRKVELANYIKEKKGVPKDIMAEVTATLGLDMVSLKESDYDKIKNEIDKKLGGE